MASKYSKDDVQKIYDRGAKIEKRLHKINASREPFIRRTISWFPINLILISLLSYLLALFLGNICTYDVTYDYYVDENGERVDTVITHVCYTTKTGDCYHAEDCTHLRKSRYKTTVYEAEDNGYEPCSECTPREVTTILLTEPDAKITTKQETVTERTTSEFFIAIVGAILLGTIIKGIVIFTAPKRAQRKLNKLDKILEVIAPYQ